MNNESPHLLAKCISEYILNKPPSQAMSDTRLPNPKNECHKEAQAMDAEVGLEKTTTRHLSEDELSDEQKKIEGKVIQKVDYRLIPILGILYSVSGIDRVNLSNARVAGMNEDLRFDIGDRYSIALLVFFITYFLFELPTTLLLRPVGARNLLNCFAIS